MSAEAREQFARFILDGDLARYAKGLPAALEDDFTGTMQLLRDKDLQNLLMNYPRKPRVFYVAYATEDEVESEWLIRAGVGQEYRPEENGPDRRIPCGFPELSCVRPRPR